MDRISAAARQHAPVLATVAITVVWTGLALRTPTSTFHFAPAIAGATWPVVARSMRGPRTPGEAVRAAAGGFSTVVFTAVELEVLDSLRGPAFFGLSGLGEALLFGLVGAIVGAAWSTVPTASSR